METVAIVGILTAGTILNSLLNNGSQSNIETCVNAFYADKFNGDRHGSPSKTFLKCMKATHPETFEEVKKRYSAEQSSAATSR